MTSVSDWWRKEKKKKETWISLKKKKEKKTNNRKGIWTKDILALESVDSFLFGRSTGQPNVCLDCVTF